MLIYLDDTSDSDGDDGGGGGGETVFPCIAAAGETASADGERLCTALVAGFQDDGRRILSFAGGGGGGGGGSGGSGEAQHAEVGAGAAAGAGGRSGGGSDGRWPWNLTSAQLEATVAAVCNDPSLLRVRPQPGLAVLIPATYPDGYPDPYTWHGGCPPTAATGAEQQQRGASEKRKRKKSKWSRRVCAQPSRTLPHPAHRIPAKNR